MKQTITATYRDGAFHPDRPCGLSEGARVEVTELSRGVRPPEEADPDERRRIAGEVAKSMMDSPLCLGFPELTREQMHERR